MAGGIFRLYVKPSDSQPWGLLETFTFDDAAKRRKEWRVSVLASVRKCQMLWSYNFWQFRNAAFACEEQADAYSSPEHIFGTRRDRKDRFKVPGGLKRKIPTKRPTKRIVKARNAKRSATKKGKRK